MVLSSAQSPSTTTSEKVTVGSASQLSTTFVGSPVMLKSLASLQSTVMSAGTSKVGFCISATRMVCIFPVTLPHKSRARQVRTMVLLWIQLPASSASVKNRRTLSAGVQLSIASNTSPVIAKSVGSCVQSRVILSGTVKVGALSSSIVMVCLKMVVFPQLSDDIQVRMILYSYSEHDPSCTWLLVSEKFNSGEVSQLSTAITVGNGGIGSSQERTRFSSVGMPINSGPTVSIVV